MISSLLKPTIVVNNKKYKVMKQIGEGGFAFVYNVMSASNSSERYALKKMICQTDEQLDEAKKEIDTMMKVKHSNIVPLLDFAYVLNKKGQKEVLLVLPLYQSSVQNIIDQGPGYPHCAFLDGLDVLKIIRQIAEGLSAIHACGLRHADLKPANILLTESYQAVITDFGSVSPAPIVVHSRAEALEIQEKAAQFTTASYRAPELYNTPSECTIAFESDIWSLGCLLYCMFYSRSPFETAAEGLSTLSIMSAHYQVPESNLWPREYLDVVAACLTPEPHKRATLPSVQSSLHCIPCPPLNLRAPTPPPPPSPTTPVAHTGAAAHGHPNLHPPPIPSNVFPRTQLSINSGGSVGGLGSSTSTTSSAVSTSQIAFSASTTSFSEQGGSMPHTPVTPQPAATLSAEDLNFAHFPQPAAENDTASGESAANHVHLSHPNGSNDEFASCGSALSGLAFDDHNFEGSVFNSSVADSYIIAEHEHCETMSNLSTGNNSPHGGGHGKGLHAGHTPRSHASFEGYELTETQLRRAQFSVAQTTAGNDPTSPAQAGVMVVAAGTSAVLQRSVGSAGTAGSESSDVVLVSDSVGAARSVGFESDEDEFGEFTTGEGAATLPAAAFSVTANNSATAVPSNSTSTEIPTAKPPTAASAAAAPAKHNGTEVITSLAVLDLWQVITEEVARPHGVVKEGPVYMMRQSGFPKRWAKKQVYLVLTAHGLILRKDNTPAARVHALLALHRPTHLTPTDTLTIGLNGLLVQGCSPVPTPGHSATAHSPVPDAGPAEWVKVVYRPTGTGSHPTETDSDAGGAPTTFRAQFEATRFEISFDSKDLMNDWIDAIMERREALLC